MFGMGTGVTPPLWPPGNLIGQIRTRSDSIESQSKRCQSIQHMRSTYGQASRPISTGQLNALLRLHTQPINLVVFQGSLGAYAQGDLILRRASRLDAFSAYPIRT